MQKYHSATKRALEKGLAFAIILLMLMSTLMFGVAASGGSTLAEKTNGQVVAENYDLTAAEKELLQSGYLTEATQNYQVPGVSDDLISVDIDNKIITMETFTGSDGSVWNPVAVDIVVNNNPIETLPVTGNTVTYTTDEAAFAVKVKYEYKDSIGEAEQIVLLSASKILTDGINNLNAILDLSGDIQVALGIFAQYSMMELPEDSLNSNPEGKAVFQYLLDDGYDFSKGSLSGTAQFTVENGQYDPASKLWAQLEANGGKLDLAVIADEYAVAPSKVQFLVENAERIMNVVAETRDNLHALNGEYGTIGMMTAFAPEGALKQVLGSYSGAMIDLAGRGEGTGSLDAYAVADAWDILNTNPVRNNLTDGEYILLDALVDALPNNINGASMVLKNPLTIATTEIQYNMSMYNVSIKVQLNVISNNVPKVYGTEELTLTFAQYATDAEILAAIQASGIEADAIAAWGAALVDGQYVRVESELPTSLESDVEYTITYNPKDYEVDNLGDVSILPYGYKIFLPVHENSNKAFDYKVNGTYYAQGTYVTVDNNLIITRTEGKSYVSYPVVDIAIENFFNGSDDGFKKAVAILTSGAINSAWMDREVAVRLPELENLITLVGATLTAETYPSSYKGLDWEPYAYIVNGTEHFFNGETVVTIAESDYDNVQVVYRLTFTDIIGIQSLLDIPKILAGEADDQIAALNALNNYYAQMGEIGENKFAISVLETAVKNEGDKNGDDVIEDPDMKELYDALHGFYRNCFSDNSLKLYNLMTGYRNEGLAYYYRNYNEFTNEIDSLYNYLLVIGDYKEELKVIVAASLPDQAETANKAIDKIDELKAAIDTLKQDLKAPNALIDLDSANLDKLALALSSAGTIPTVIEQPIYISESYVKAADGKVSVNIKLDGKIVVGPTFNKGHILDQFDIDAIVAAVEAKMAELNYNSKYYTCDFDRSAFDVLVGNDAEALVGVSYEFNYTINKYPVEIEGVGTTEIDINNLTVSLPASTDSVYRYEYIVFGKVITARNYTFTSTEFDQIISKGGYAIIRNEINLADEARMNLVNDLNKAIGSDLIVFALTEKNGQYSIVMKIDASNPGALMSGFMGMMTGLMKYEYVALDDRAMIYTTDEDGLQISVQALIDTILYSGFSSNQMIGMMDANGNVKNMAMPGTVVSDKPMSKAGALLTDTILCLNSASGAEYEFPLYITLGAVSPEIVSVRNLFADRLGGYFGFESANGKASLRITLPNKAYEVYLAALLATETIDFTDVNAVNEAVAFGFIEDILTPLMQSDASIISIQNTLANLGYNIDLSGYEDAFELVRKFYLNSEFVYNEVDSTYDTCLNVNIDPYLEKFNLGVVGDLIVEKGDYISIPLSAYITNLDKDYEAIYFDVNADGLQNKVGFVEDLSAKLGSVSGTAVFVLLSDINDNLTFNTTSILNLNGFTVNGNIVGNATVTILDNTMEGNYTGAVTGSVAGKVVVAGGKYSSNVSAYIPSGYEQNNGIVTNKYINIIKDENGNITVGLDASLFTPNSAFDPETLVVDIVAELLLNGYTTNKCYIDGIQLYELTLDDVIAIYTASDRKAALMEQITTFGSLDNINKLLNSFVDKMLDFEAISTILKKDVAYGSETPVMSFNLVTGTWDIAFDYDAVSDSIDVDILTKNEKSSKLNVVLTGSKEDKKQIADMTEILADTTDIELDIVIKRKSGYTSWGIVVNGNLTMDLSGDSDYAAIVGIIVADSIGASANAELKQGLETYFKKGDNTQLKDAIHKLTIADIIKAIKQYGKDDSLQAMLNNIGLSKYYDANLRTLEAKLHNTIAVASRVLNKLDVTGPASVIGNFLNGADDEYTFNKSNIIKSITVSGITCDLEISEFFGSVKLFGANKPTTPGGTITIIVDYSPLTELIAEIEAKGLVASDYTADSWAHFESKLGYAKNFVKKQNAGSQVQVTAACIDLENAYNSLVRVGQPPIVIDYSKLEAKIAELEAKNLVESEYTADSWANYVSKLNAAKELVNKKNAASQTQVNNVLTNLNNAYNGLVTIMPPVVIDYTELEAKIAELEAKNLVASDYTTDSWNKYDTALDDAKELANKKNAASQNQVNNVLANLTNAYNGLKKINYSALQAKIAELEAKNLVESDYTVDSWDAYTAALAAAKKLVDEQSADEQSDVDVALANLDSAYKALEKFDTSVLEKLIAEIEKLNKDDYTPETWAAVMAALDEAKAALETRDQSAVDGNVTDLSDAFNKLEKKSNAWIWIVVVCVILVAGAGVAVFFYLDDRRKKQLADSTPLVDLNADGAEAVAEGAEAAEAVAENAEAAEAVAEGVEAAEAVAEGAEAAEAVAEGAEAAEAVAENAEAAEAVAENAEATEEVAENAEAAEAVAENAEATEEVAENAEATEEVAENNDGEAKTEE